MPREVVRSGRGCRGRTVLTARDPGNHAQDLAGRQVEAASVLGERRPAGRGGLSRLNIRKRCDGRSSRYGSARHCVVLTLSGQLGQPVLRGRPRKIQGRFPWPASGRSPNGRRDLANLCASFVEGAVGLSPPSWSIGRPSSCGWGLDGPVRRAAQVRTWSRRS